jgi:L-aspartate oxidase
MKTLHTDILIVGTGIAGLSFALRAAEYADVIMATKKEQSASNTNYAQGGIASVLAPTDSVDGHVADTLAAGAGLCQEDVVREIVQEGPQAVRDLIDWGVAFSRESGEPSRWHLGLEGGHSQARVVHAGDFTGREIEGALLGRARAHPRVHIHEHHMATRLLVDRGRLPGEMKCYGATESLWLTGLELESLTWSSCNSIPPACTDPDSAHFSFQKQCGERVLN